MSWGFEGDKYLAISIETRKEQGEQCSALRGFFRQYELVFVVADERDVVRLRRNVRGEDVYVHRLDVPPAGARVLLIRYLQEVNQLRMQAPWYKRPDGQLHDGDPAPRPAGRAPIVVELEALRERVPELAYDIGAIDRSLPFSVLQANGHINERAKAANDDPRFSVRIREGLPRMSMDRSGTR